MLCSTSFSPPGGAGRIGSPNAPGAFTPDFLDPVEAEMPVKCAGVAVCVQHKEQFPACTFLSHTALLVQKGQIFLSVPDHTFK